jgi:predicted transcriptional regulator
MSAHPVDAIAFAHKSLARDLRLARASAGLTQVALARKVQRSQSKISKAEAGKGRITEYYVAAVLRACGLPRTWKAPRP